VAGTVLGSASRGDVDSAMVDGAFVKRNGALVGIDMAGIRADLIRARDRLYTASGYEDSAYEDRGYEEGGARSAA
jgi:hypothetical protein